MENRFEHIEELIARVLSGEATIHDQKILDEWITLSVENAQQFELSKKIFSESAGLRNSINVDTDAAWLRLKSRMNAQKPAAKIISIDSRKSWETAFRIAAIFIVVAGLGAAYYFLQGITVSQWIV